MDIIVDNTTNNTTQNKKRRRTRQDWQTLVQTWESANQTQLAFCQDHGLCYRQFSQWKSRFKLEGLAEPENAETHFVPVQLAPSDSTSVTSGVRVHLPNGICLELSSEAYVPVLVGSAKALMALSC